ncbi:hypothetical protein CI109_102855 [Kwoniella shandongensis]|uniref:Uncharacterized protein n=1 Tax=Kwoniella shandongensis TaxID=1734106 RepID=A0A5M6C7U1_9TREE|nr:uncharacterized protein CI109_000045 [Kwoniella shandongensis]KAA5531207.1 hypothetical protein CI109_000045 [Kwoniella shandongensis]
MPPTSSLAALMASPATSGGDATVLAHGQTLPDISLGSLGSSFRSEDEERRELERRPGPGGALGLGRPSRLSVAHSPETSNSVSITTPSPPRLPSSALLSLSPPTTVRKSSSHSVLPESNAPRRPRVLRRRSTSASSQSSLSSSTSDIDGPLKARYGGGGDTDDEAVLSSLSLAMSPKKGGMGGRTPYHGGPSRRGGRHSVAAGDIAGNGPLTLRDQEKQLEDTKKEVFNLQLENHFLKERLSNMAPEHIEAALKENVKLKLEILNLSKELKKLKKLVLQQDRDLAAAAREKGGAGAGGLGGNEARELERMWKEEKERRKAAEENVKRLQAQAEAEQGRGGATEEELKAQLEDTEASEAVWRQRAEQLEEELEDQRATNEDQREELDKLRDTADRAQDEAENLKTELENAKGLRESVGVSKGREQRLAQKVQELEQENASLQADLSLAKRGALSETDAELLEEKLNELQDQLAAAQLDVDSRDREIEELNNELDIKLKDHDKELQQVEDEWRDEVLEARAQVDELKDALDAREQEAKEAREALLEREEELTAALEKVSELQAAQAETHDRLEETLKNIERDNVEKDAELLEANREVEELGQRVFELEEGVEELRAREADLNADLRSADEAFENAKTHYENLVAALKEARRKLQEERDDALDRLRREADGRASDRETARADLETEKERSQRALREKDQLLARLQNELESARDRVALRERDLASVEHALRDLEDERRKIGDDHTSDRFGLELEIERVKRDLERCEDELEVARRELDGRDERLRSRDIEVARMLDKQRDLENRLASERQGRLNVSDKLDQTNKSAKQHEREVNILRERIEELEPLLTETQQERFQLQRQSEQQRQERSELLLRVFKDVNRFLGTEDHTTPANFAVFRDTLLQRLRSMIHVRMDFEKKIKETESNMDQRMASLKKQLEQKWRALDNFEASVKKLELTRMQWRSKYAVKEGELEAAKSRNTELSQQLSSVKAGSTTESSSHIRSLHERAQSAEKRAQQASNQLAMLEARVAELQSKNGQAENKWEVRVKEYENRLRIAGEKIKTEKQGGKERALQLEAQVRDLERQVQDARRRNQRAEGVVATAAHLID